MRSLPDGVSRADLALAVGLAAVVLTEATSQTYGWPLLTVPVSALAMLALAVRRRWPAGVAVGVSAVQVPLALLSESVYAPQLPVLGVLLALYTAATELSGRRLVVAGVATLALMVAAQTATAEGDLWDFWPLLLWAGPQLAGRLVRRRTLEAAAAATVAGQVLARRDAETAEAVARERDRIARDLHDVVAHAVSLMVVQAGAERLALAGVPEAERTRRVLGSVEAAGREAMAELRAMLGVLRAPQDEAAERRPQPDLALLRELVARVRSAGTTVHCRTAGDLDDVPAGVGLSAYRVAQEALTNAVRHAPGSPVELSVTVSGDGVRVHVRNPLTSVPPQRAAGRGVVGLRERAALHAGTAQAGPVDGCWVVDVRLPLPARPAVVP